MEDSDREVLWSQALSEQSCGFSVENTSWEAIKISHLKNNDAVH